jgi:5-(carboxyamino)imidazole ribonucleotide mutase
MAEPLPSSLAPESPNPLVGLIMGSKSDWETMERAAATLSALEIPHERRIVSAHRTPDWMAEYAKAAEGRGIEVIIAAAGGAAHLPGMPVKSSILNGIDSLLSIVQMPAGVPVGTLAIGGSGAANAALLAAGILGNKYPEIRARLKAWRERQTLAVREERLP